MIGKVSGKMASVHDNLINRGVEVETHDWGLSVPAPPAEISTLDEQVAFVPLFDGRPLSVVSAVENATRQGKLPVIVTDRHTRSDVMEILSSPIAVEDIIDGRRQFYAVEDRIRLTDGSFACIDRRGSLQWSEVDPATETDSPAIQLTVDDDIIAVVDSIASLSCPGPTPSAFPVRYKRSNKQFQVFRDERLVAQFGTVTEMRADGYRPAPLPLIPEHHLRHNPTLARNALLAIVDDGEVTYASID